MEQREIEVRGTRALERRFGASLWCDYQWTGRTLRITDRETGSWVEVLAWGRRVLVTREHDGAA